MELVGMISVIDIESARDGKNEDEPNDDWSIIPVQCLKATTSPFYQSSQTLIALDGVQCAILSTFCRKPLLYEGLLLITLDPLPILIAEKTTDSSRLLVCFLLVHLLSLSRRAVQPTNFCEYWLHPSTYKSLRQPMTKNSAHPGHRMQSSRSID